MRTYRTKDTGEALALQCLGIPEPEAPERVLTPEQWEEERETGKARGQVWWTFEDSRRREDASHAFNAQYTRGGFDWIPERLNQWINSPDCPASELIDELIPAVFCHAMRMRRRFQKHLHEYEPRVENPD